MARGPDTSGFGAGASLADHLFNADSLADLAGEFAVLPGFDADRFVSECLPGLPERALMARLDWIADHIDAQLPQDFVAKAEALEAAMPPPLDPTLRDDDFGRFIHAVPGILAVRHGRDMPERALDLLYQATQRFSMEYYIRPFFLWHPDKTLKRLHIWKGDANYHVRRLVSEGMRPKLPWAQALPADPAVTLPLLRSLHGDGARFVTRSVANHLNDLSKTHPAAVLEELRAWQKLGQQSPKELDWMTRHALRTAVKRGERGALDLLGYHAGDIQAQLALPESVEIGAALELSVTLVSPEDRPVMIDYRLAFQRPGGRSEKVFKLKTGTLRAGKPQNFAKRHKLKGDATTFRLHPGVHRVTVQVNGQDVASGEVTFLQA